VDTTGFFALKIGILGGMHGNRNHKGSPSVIATRVVASFSRGFDHFEIFQNIA
jgi:hypothetical protein